MYALASIVGVRPFDLLTVLCFPDLIKYYYYYVVDISSSIAVAVVD